MDDTGSQGTPMPPAHLWPRMRRATLHIRCTNGSKFTVLPDLGTTVGAFKATIAEGAACQAPNSA